MVNRQVNDSYCEFLRKCKITDTKFLEVGVELMKFIDRDIAKKRWDQLKYQIENEVTVPIRGYGRNAQGSKIYQNLYSELGIKIEIDQANNKFPTRVISELSSYSKSASIDENKTSITNYQVSHIFGRTHNVFCFTAPWNIAYVPKIFDPLTGHETKGDLKVKFSKLFVNRAHELFGDQIKDFNTIMCAYSSRITDALTEIDADAKFRANVESNFSAIPIP